MKPKCHHWIDEPMGRSSASLAVVAIGKVRESPKSAGFHPMWTTTLTVIQSTVIDLPTLLSVTERQQPGIITKYLFYVLSVWFPEGLNSGLLALCGPNRVVDESTCECVCRNGLTEDSCDPGWKLDHNTCKEGFSVIGKIQTLQRLSDT